MASAGAPAGYAAIPTLPMNTALTLTFDVIRIPIPIPRLRTIDVPPEAKLTYVQVGAAPAVGAVAAPMAVAQQPTYVQQTAAVQAAGGEECIRPEHIAAAAAILRSQSGQGRSASESTSAPAAAAVDPRLKLVEELERRCDELEKQKAAKKEAAEGWAPSHK